MICFPLNKHSILRNWQFCRDEPDAVWAPVELPHSSVMTDLNGADHWQGICRYRRGICVDNTRPDERFALFFNAAMHTAIVLVDGVEAGRHSGGYLPFEVDVTRWLSDGQRHELVVELDNRNAPEIPPGKNLEDLDFCWYGGLYRDVELRRYAGVHITEPVSADEVAGGGIFVRTLRATEGVAELLVRVHLRNTSSHARSVNLSASVCFGDVVVAEHNISSFEIGDEASSYVELPFILNDPALWSPASPNLYEVEISLMDENGECLDARRERFGIRRIEMSRSGGLCINEQRIRPRGTNRHQDYPWAAYALPAAAQRRDARRIKEAGFDYVRLSHYPQSADFLDACDELGILVMNCLPGWQYIGGQAFMDACYSDAQTLIRRDRNHPSVILWELSLNETPMPEAFMVRMHQIGHEEYPGDQMFTCGWIDRYDVFTHSRQHGEIHTWQNGDKALVVAEYGDWEYYASNEGFDQKSGQGLLPTEGNSRVFRGDGEAAMLQQASNFAEALDDTLSSPVLTDGQWVMFDYPRGYDPLRASCGLMDFFRLPKFAYYFYRSQRAPSEGGGNWSGGPVLFIATHWTPESSPLLRVFSNVEEVELCLNGRMIARKKPERTGGNIHLPHPPFVFDTGGFEAGLLEAVGYIEGKPLVRHSVATPKTPVRMRVWVDAQDLSCCKGPDLLLAHAAIVDAEGTLCVEHSTDVCIKVSAPMHIVGPSTVETEAGIASFVIRKNSGELSGGIQMQSDEFGCAEIQL